MQLKKLGLADNEHIQMKSQLFLEVTSMYDQMGDQISMQYGGSIAHHAQLGKKKGFFAAASELVTSVKRHLANNFSDPNRQNVINLFLGIYQPLKNSIPIWNLQDEKETHTLAKLQQKFLARKHLEMALSNAWWERHLRGFEAQLPPQLMHNLYRVFKKIVPQTRERSNTPNTADIDVTDVYAVAMDEDADSDEDDVAQQLVSVRDGSVDLLLVLGFDRDIYSSAMKYRNDSVKKNKKHTHECFISQEFRKGFKSALRDSFLQSAKINTHNQIR